MDSITASKQEKNIDSLDEVLFYQQPNYLNIKILHNNKEKIVLNKTRIQLFSNGIEIKGIDTTTKILFHKVDPDAKIELKLYDGKEVYTFSGFFGKDLNKGGDFYFVTISNFNKISSRAEENSMDYNSPDYKTYRSRFIIAKDYSVDIPEYKKIKKINFIIFRPREYGDGTYITSIENIEYRK